MTIYDGVMIGLVVLGMLWGAWRGFTWQVASLASLIVGYASSHQLSSRLSPHLPGEPIVARALSMLVIYALVSGAIFLAAWAIRTTLRKLRFEAYDRHLGMIVGALEGGFIGVVGTLFVVSLAPATRTPVFASQSGHVVAQILNAVGPALPVEARNVLEPFFDGNVPPRGETSVVEAIASAAAKQVEHVPGLETLPSRITGQDSSDSQSADVRSNAVEHMAEAVFGNDDTQRTQSEAQKPRRWRAVERNRDDLTKRQTTERLEEQAPERQPRGRARR
jgi:membrane protein required for colicin V production